MFLQHGVGWLFPEKEIGFFYPWYVSVFFLCSFTLLRSSTHCILGSVLNTPIKYHHFSWVKLWIRTKYGVAVIFLFSSQSLAIATVGMCIDCSL